MPPPAAHNSLPCPSATPLPAWCPVVPSPASPDPLIRSGSRTKRHRIIGEYRKAVTLTLTDCWKVTNNPKWGKNNGKDGENGRTSEGSQNGPVGPLANRLVQRIRTSKLLQT